MRGIAGAILVLAGAILIGAGIVADALRTGTDSTGTSGYVLGGVIGVVGICMIFAGAMKKDWDAISVDDDKTTS